MGSSSSRAAQVARQAQRQTSIIKDSLEGLSPTSAVRRDAELAEELDSRRIELESTPTPLEELNRKDEKIVELMQNAMKRPEGNIVYREHVLPLDDSDMSRSMESKVHLEQADTDSVYAARDASEEHGGGRLNQEQLIDAMKTIQNARGSDSILQSLAQKYGCNAEILRQVADCCSVPIELETMVGREVSRQAVWR